MRALALAFLAALSCGSAAAPFAVRLGNDRVALDTVPGFADAMELGSPRLIELAEAMTSPSNRILLFALTDGDLRKFTQGDVPDLRRYLLVATPRATERTRMGTAEFRAYADDALRTAAGAAQPPDIRKHLDGLPTGQPSLLFELRRTPEIVSVMQGTRVPVKPDAKPQYLLTTTTLMLINGRAISVAAFSATAEDADVNWLRLTTQRWVEDLQRLNR